MMSGGKVKRTVSFRGDTYREAVVFAVEHDATLSAVVERAVRVYLRAAGRALPPSLEDVRLPDLVPASSAPPAAPVSAPPEPRRPRKRRRGRRR